MKPDARTLVAVGAAIGALVDWFKEHNPTRALSVLAAVLFFSLVHVAGYREGVEGLGLIFLLGGCVQAFG